MEFSEYRSKSLKALWPKFYKQFDTSVRNLVRKPKFSTHVIDNICAQSWKIGNTIDICVDVLLYYISELED